MAPKSKHQLSDAVRTFIDVFTKYAATDGEQCERTGAPSLDTFMMSKDEFKEMMQKEYCCKGVKDPATLDAKMNKLDESKDGVLHFAEFVPLVIDLSMECYLWDMVQKIHEQAEQKEQAEQVEQAAQETSKKETKMEDEPKYQLSDAVQTFIDVFSEYAATDGGKCERTGGPSLDTFMMSKEEFKKMMQKEYRNEDVKDPATLDKMMNELDKNNDGQLHFAEFVHTIFEMSMKCYLRDMLQKIHEQAERMKQAEQVEQKKGKK